MRAQYWLRLSEYEVAIADLVPMVVMGAYYLTRINVPRAHRGKGYGSKLLDQILADADRLGSTIWLGISPSDGLNYPQLRSWYERRGFRLTEGVWVRDPVKQERVEAKKEQEETPCSNELSPVAKLEPISLG